MITKIDILKVTGRSEKEKLSMDRHKTYDQLKWSLKFSSSILQNQNYLTKKLPRYIPDEYSEKRFGNTQIHSYTHQCSNFLFCFLGFGHIVRIHFIVRQKKTFHLEAN